MAPEEYEALSPEQQKQHDAAERAREAAEQAELPYTWKQQLDAVEVSVPVPSGTKGRDLVVELKKRKIKVALKGKDAILEGELAKDIKEDDSTWTIEDGNLVEIHLEKMNKNEWWPNVVSHHPRIDTTKIVPENSKLSDLDPETRAMVEKMMFDNRQKAMNRPTSDQLQQQEMLAKLAAANPNIDFSNAKFNASS
ncbi:nuclear movement protein nudC [Moesziomyces antarcticus]|uniref:Nuclear movement protein nudC n=2 Tax=Pseudozyma antarctica TaxID=84753 RepID=A0A081CCS0_PSEA2|nr:nuclear movement protein nudC [Moesziomyces antarcticus]GAK64466.1 nuclear movement protein nudC [Moesziomyces antarcticus]SPO45025.1 probable nudC protein [Moesziomyces antarcticus]